MNAQNFAMNAMRSSYVTGFLISLPLFIWTWGSIAGVEPEINAAQIIKQALDVLWCLQITAIILSTSWYRHEHSAVECCLANMCLILIPLPFVSLAWLASAVSFLFVIKIIAVQLIVSLLGITVVLKLKQGLFFNCLPVNLATPLSLTAAAITWNTRELWLNWLS